MMNGSMPLVNKAGYKMASMICFVLGGLLITGGLLAEYTRMSASDIAEG